MINEYDSKTPVKGARLWELITLALIVYLAGIFCGRWDDPYNNKKSRIDSLTAECYSTLIKLRDRDQKLLKHSDSLNEGYFYQEYNKIWKYRDSVINQAMKK